MTETPNHPLPYASDDERERVAREQMSSYDDLFLLRRLPGDFIQTLDPNERRAIDRQDPEKDSDVLQKLAKRYKEWKPRPIDPEANPDLTFYSPTWAFAYKGFHVYRVEYDQADVRKEVFCVCEFGTLVSYYRRDEHFVASLPDGVRTAVCAYGYPAFWERVTP